MTFGIHNLSDVNTTPTEGPVSNSPVGNTEIILLLGLVIALGVLYYYRKQAKIRIKRTWSLNKGARLFFLTAGVIFVNWLFINLSYSIKLFVLWNVISISFIIYVLIFWEEKKEEKEKYVVKRVE